VLSEVVELFPGPYVHIGGDEVEKEAWRQSPEAQAILRREGLKDEDELQSYLIRRIERFLTSKNRRMIGWDEILQGGLAPHAIVMSWRGEAGGIEAARMKHSAIMSPTDYCYFDYSQGDRKREPVNIGGYIPLAKAYRYEPVPKELSAEEADYILGAQANLWTEYIADPDYAEYMLFPRLLAFSESVWSPAAGKDYADFMRRLPYQLGRLDKQAVRYRIPEPRGLEDFYTTTEDHAVVELQSLVAGSRIHYTLDGSDPTDASPALRDAAADCAASGSDDDAERPRHRAGRPEERRLWRKFPASRLSGCDPRNRSATGTVVRAVRGDIHHGAGDRARHSGGNRNFQLARPRAIRPGDEIRRAVRGLHRSGGGRLLPVRRRIGRRSGPQD
jgi:hypothetical protein